MVVELHCTWKVRCSSAYSRGIWSDSRCNASFGMQCTTNILSNGRYWHNGRYCRKHHRPIWNSRDGARFRRCIVHHHCQRHWIHYRSCFCKKRRDDRKWGRNSEHFFLQLCSTGDRSPVYKVAPDKSGLFAAWRAWFIKRCSVALWFIAGVNVASRTTQIVKIFSYLLKFSG